MARIGINAVFLDPARMGGAETYTRQLIAGLQNLDVTDDFFVLAPRNHDLVLANPRFQLIECPIDASCRYRRILWEQLRLPRVMARLDLDLAHFPYGTMPYWFRGQGVVTIHDTIRFSLPREKPLFPRLYRELMESRIAGSARQVIAVSQCDARDISRHVGIPAQRLSSVYHGVAEEFFSRMPAPAASRDSLLWVGRAYPRKNVAVLIRACGILARRRVLPPVRLVGIERPYRPQVEAWVRSAGLQEQVSLEPPVPHAKLPALLNTAQVFVYPSRYESFGLPVLEAMACGAPTVCADIPAFRELHPEHTLFADPDAPEQFASAIERLLTDSALWHRLSRQGIEHAAGFTWESCARQTHEIYRALLRGSGRRRRERPLRRIGLETIGMSRP